MSTETTVQRLNTTAFIAARPTSIVLTPYTRTRTNTGGYTTSAGTPRAAQTMRIITMSEDVKPVRTVDGVERKIDFMLLGEWNAVVARDDRFTYEGDTYIVVDLLPTLDYETRALVVRHG